MYDEFKRIFKSLSLNYQKTPDKDLCEFWFEELETFDIKEIDRAIKNIISKEKYFPNLNRIYEELNSIGFKEASDEQMGERFKKITPNWYGKEIKNQEIDEETITSFEEFQDFIKEFRNEKTN